MSKEVYSPPPEIVFDAEPLVAHADDEPGSDKVDAYLNSVADGVSTGYLNAVNATEVRYILTRISDAETADNYLAWLSDIGVERVNSDLIWSVASDYVIDYNPALGDAYALATAEYADGTLLVGADDDYDPVISDTTANVSIERFRTKPA
jgi:predicted nucleic acid-binding protein